MTRERRDGRVFIRNIERGMIFRAEVLLAEARGSEQTHYKPTPWLVVSSDAINRRLPIVQAVPFTTKLHKGEGQFRAHSIRVLALHVTRFATTAGTAPLHDGDQLALTEQLRVLSHDRLLGDPVGRVSKQALFSVEAGIRFVCGIPPWPPVEPDGATPAAVPAMAAAPPLPPSGAGSPGCPP
ncbi:MAG: type II toxin-antitoxin system PemK/MazF family toxin [Deltaproteobacteria bacterium]|nr:type II toxin-antitoxin system PemK/MazF family toxin [Deltaproteobacteria bacterium]